jgi:hypothetical protein
MATIIEYISLENLQTYDSKLKPYIESRIKSGSSDSLKTVSLDGNTLKFYNVPEPVGETTPVYSIELPETDLTDIRAAIKANTSAIATLNGTADVEGSVAKAVKDASDSLTTTINNNKKELDDKIGSLDTLATTEKSDIVGAINENKAAIDAAQSSGKISISTDTTTSGMLKSYTLMQGTTKIGTIDIPKDMVVKSGTVEQNPTGLAAGTYLVLTLANAAEDKVYINVGTLVDIYTAETGATQIQLNIDSSTREISANIVAGSVTATELANNAVTAAKIANGNVTKSKLSTSLQASINKADTALQESDVSALRTSVAANTASMAEGGATYNSIVNAQSAADAAQGDVDALEKRVDSLESVTFQEATDAEIDALFSTT